MRVLICGSRDFTNSRAVDSFLFGLSSTIGDDPEFIVIHGAAKGADSFAGKWARNFGDGVDTREEPYPADWDRYGRSAGPRRNRQMLTEGKPDLVVAFVNKPLSLSKGTNDMVSIARAAGVPTWVVEVFD